jgi:hypothetical protein
MNADLGDLSRFPPLDVYRHQGREQADCPGCGMAGRVDRKRDGLLLFECDAQCGTGSGIYRALNGVGPRPRRSK